MNELRCATWAYPSCRVERFTTSSSSERAVGCMVQPRYLTRYIRQLVIIPGQGVYLCLSVTKPPIQEAVSSGRLLSSPSRKLCKLMLARLCMEQTTCGLLHELVRFKLDTTAPFFTTYLDFTVWTPSILAIDNMQGLVQLEAASRILTVLRWWSGKLTRAVALSSKIHPHSGDSQIRRQVRGGIYQEPPRAG